MTNRSHDGTNENEAQMNNQRQIEHTTQIIYNCIIISILICVVPPLSHLLLLFSIYLSHLLVIFLNSQFHMLMIVSAFDFTVNLFVFLEGFSFFSLILDFICFTRDTICVVLL